MSWLLEKPQNRESWVLNAREQLNRLKQADDRLSATFPNGLTPPDEQPELRAFMSEAMGTGIVLAGLLSFEESDEPA